MWKHKTKVKTILTVVGFLETVSECNKRNIKEIEIDDDDDAEGGQEEEGDTCSEAVPCTGFMVSDLN